MAAVINPSFSYAVEEELVTEEQLLEEPEVQKEKIQKEVKAGKDAILYENVKVIAVDADASKALFAKRCQLELEDEQDELMAELEKERLIALENLQKMILSKLSK